MIYFKDTEILIRDMIQSDAQIITDEEIAQGWHQTIDKYEMRLRHQAQGKSVALIAEYKGNILEYTDMESAFAVIEKLANSGDVCLLSPAAASYDRYKNFEERGRIFKELAKKF